MKLLSFNIFRGYNTQFDNRYNWQKRQKNIANFINTNYDVILLQECNRLQWSDSMEKFMAEMLPNYRYNIYYSSNNIYRSKAQIIAYNPEKLFKVEEKVKWLSDTPDISSDNWGYYNNNYGKILVANKFAKIIDGKISNEHIWIMNTHFDVDITPINNSIKIIPHIINSITNNDNTPVIVGGDFNIYSNLLFNAFNNIGYKRLSRNYVTADLTKLDFTFIGKRDQYNKINEYMYLDHLFGKNIKKYIVYCPFYYDTIINEYMLSDHLPIVCDFEF